MMISHSVHCLQALGQKEPTKVILSRAGDPFQP